MTSKIVYVIEGFDKTTEWRVERVDVTHVPLEELAALSGAADIVESDGSWPLDEQAVRRFEAALGIKLDDSKNDYFLTPYDLGHPASGSSED